MQKILLIVTALVFTVLFLVFNEAFFVVNEAEQVVITRFGEPIGKPFTNAGLYWKFPLLDAANRFDKRILEWDGDPNQIPTLDKRYIWVDTTARWRIVDPLKFMQSVRNESSAQARLDDIIDSATRDVISNHKVVEVVRNSNRLVDNPEMLVVDEEDSMDVSRSELEPISVGREQLSRNILERTIQYAPDFGIEILDVRIQRINYIEEVQKKVYDRMISERKRAAEKIRSEGQGKRAEIEGQMQKELQDIQSEAYKSVQEIKGKADADAIRIYADAYNRDPSFYAFLKTLETYRETMNKDTTLILSTEHEFFRYLNTLNTNP